MADAQLRIAALTMRNCERQRTVDVNPHRFVSLLESDETDPEQVRLLDILRRGERHQWWPSLKRTLPLRWDFNECSNAPLNCSRGYTCSTAAESDPSATRSPSFW